jgi:hypothetical protein
LFPAKVWKQYWKFLDGYSVCQYEWGSYCHYRYIQEQ